MGKHYLCRFAESRYLCYIYFAPFRRRPSMVGITADLIALRGSAGSPAMFFELYRGLVHKETLPRK